MVNALPQHIDHAAFANLAREASEELEAVDVLRAVGADYLELGEPIGLSGAQECEELGHVERVRAVEVLRAAGGVTGATVCRRAFSHAVRRYGEAGGAGHMPDDDGLESPFADVGGHVSSPKAP
ncbi:hypothetical protein [Gemmatimonas groenlandica]|uniref:hypothetical protein n=1 Tax=Gemmatimonas groenlandica TaxID=2732249 RepID=UPI00198067C2|nr:hypothetical protein [Gemmatimonas groenlandica]